MREFILEEKNIEENKIVIKFPENMGLNDAIKFYSEFMDNKKIKLNLPHYIYIIKNI